MTHDRVRPFINARPRQLAPKPRDKNDAESHTPPAVPIVHRRTPDPGCVAARLPSAKTVERHAAAAAVDAMIAARPLKPPPLPRFNDTRSAAALALAKEIRLGDYTP